MNKLDAGLLILGGGLIVIGVLSYLATLDAIQIGNFIIGSNFQILVMIVLGIALIGRSILRDLGNEDNGI
ncbi:MAG: hypothetical protein M0Q91_17470 [Methanoregula sp.]|jgi:hypothetical protein|nr:hypothetical protein [Methanoregula sp.]